jgi:hypothetical protein
MSTEIDCCLFPFNVFDFRQMQVDISKLMSHTNYQNFLSHPRMTNNMTAVFVGTSKKLQVWLEQIQRYEQNWKT